MNSYNLMGIGVFALVSGLSIHALRHYDELGLRRPAVVDPVTVIAATALSRSGKPG